MAAFYYKAVGNDGEIVEGVLDAISREAAVSQIHVKGQVPIRVEESRHRGKKSKGRRSRRKAVKLEQITSFTREMSTLLKSGQPIDGALSILMSISGEEAQLTEHLINIRDSLKGGHSFADALAKEHGLFSDFYIQMVRAGEAGGALESVLERLAVHLERSKEVKDSLISALIYPLILLFVALTSILILMTYVIPQFSDLFQDMGQALPLSTQITMAVAGGLQNYGWLMALAVIGLIFFFKWQMGRRPSAKRWHGRFLKLPLIGDIIKQVEAARFCRTLGTLLENGVPLLKSVSIVKETIGNYVIADGMDHVASNLKSGQRLADPLAEYSQFPSFALHMIRIGEESGQLEPMLMQTADIIDQETQTLIKRALSLVEPIMILVLGLIIAGVVMSILVAILGVNQLVAL
ncbi:MAG: type II secretion system F family protein [Candidatus Thiodiazotropha sp. (ex Myrtea spinifera)]|nr:type II secretion system F family protein [Candidatus Thiodiazotropha sp. (ex Myrtea spinifera)]MCU7829505.1 type II secretion system F family protein [Candidatus Thiodiazotropha sp. (ex Myrtea sp. 'scaly one' KF741663)]